MMKFISQAFLGIFGSTKFSDIYFSEKAFLVRFLHNRFPTPVRHDGLLLFFFHPLDVCMLYVICYMLYALCYMFSYSFHMCLKYLGINTMVIDLMKILKRC